MTSSLLGAADVGADVLEDDPGATVAVARGGERRLAGIDGGEGIGAVAAGDGDEPGGLVVGRRRPRGIGETGEVDGVVVVQRHDDVGEDATGQRRVVEDQRLAAVVVEAHRAVADRSTAES